MQRRDFIKNSGLLLASAAFMPDMSMFGKSKQYGIQLWSVREDMKKDPKGTLAAMSKAGFKFVEGFGLENGKWFGVDTKDFKMMLDDNGLKMPSAHFMLGLKDYNASTKTLSDNWKAAIEAANILGQKYIISPWTVDEDRKDKDTLLRLAEAMNACGAYTKANGVRFGYHNHWFEFDKIGDQTMYETLLQNTDNKLVTFEMDVCWTTYTGNKPSDWFKKHPGRFELIHAKDVATGTEKTTAIVGEGIVDFSDVIKHQKIAGIKHYIIELEHYKTNAIQDVGVALNNFKKLV